MQQDSQERQRRLARDAVITKEEVAPARFRRAGEESKRRLAIYAAMNEYQLNDARLHRAR